MTQAGVPRFSSVRSRQLDSALDSVAAERRRDGAYAWGVFEDTAEPGRFIETFLVESWLEHLRQHERVTKADRDEEDRLTEFLLVPARVEHLVTPQVVRTEPH
jgi:hypothetical protein